jgi:hypothetical protein
VKVHLWGELGFYGPGRRSRFEVRLEAELPLTEAISLLGVPEADVAVVGLNGEVVRLDDPSLVVRDADRLDLFPATSGGSPRGASAARRPKPATRLALNAIPTGQPIRVKRHPASHERQASCPRSTQATASAPAGRSTSGGMKSIPLATASEASM